ncbi:unnamed protein product [Diabrotica balteata]|uniref:Fatty acid hydroxylase domain-containing protein n=1 Tax=Diabrotica balteata TaxID=107213 RepID=A0A9N9XD03_DIABA|nr:unnamed protein product [Diabrotica balteata]
MIFTNLSVLNRLLITMGSKRLDKTVQTNRKASDPLSVTWLEKYDPTVSRLWNKIPDRIGKFLATLATFLVGISINGQWANLYIHAKKQLGYTTSTVLPRSSLWESITIENLRLTNFVSYFIPTCIISYSIYFGLGGFLHWYYYVRQRNKPEEWKCQPTRWLSPDLERHEIMLGTISLTLNMLVTSLFATYVSNDGYSTIYYKFDECGWWWFFLQFPVIYIAMDYPTYWIHRIYHFPWLYKTFHKMHHRYKQPTAFSVTAIHPVESLNIQLLLMAPLFTFPVHWLPYYIMALYSYYHGLIDHSGINFKAKWWQPWQPDAIFHDNHHQYFHVNFGFNLTIWDKIHGTYRLKDRIYREEIFYGHGKSITELTPEELEQEITERKAENPLANTAEYKLSKREIKNLQKKK